MAKKLLSEAVVRRFAKLANLPSITENVYEQEEEELEFGDEAPAPVEEPMEEPLDAEIPEEEPMDDIGAAEELELTDEEAQAIIDLGKKLEAAMPAGAGEEEMDLGGEEEAVPPVGDMPPEEEEEDFLSEALKGINYVPGKKEIVEEVARRVAKRLLKARRAEAQLEEALGNKKTKPIQTRRRSKK